MKNGFCFLILTLISFCGYAQNAKHNSASKTIIVYDTVTVYDTITIYDTIKTEKKAQSSTIFKNNFTSEKAYLAIDTNNLSAAVLLINKKDTATLSINSIILSENTKNLDTMKKEILTLLTAITLAQTVKSQDSLNIIPKTEDTFPKYTISVAGTIAKIMPMTNEYGFKERGNFYGMNLSVDKIMYKNNRKRIWGLSTNFGSIYTNIQKLPTKLNKTSSDEVYRGKMVNLFFTFKFYLFGSASNYKINPYLIARFGISLITGVPVDRKSYLFSIANLGNETNYRSLLPGVQHPGIGAEWKLAQGNIFAEYSLIGSNNIYSQLQIGYKFNL